MSRPEAPPTLAGSQQRDGWQAAVPKAVWVLSLCLALIVVAAYLVWPLVNGEPKLPEPLRRLKPQLVISTMTSRQGTWVQRYNFPASKEEVTKAIIAGYPGVIREVHPEYGPIVEVKPDQLLRTINVWEGRTIAVPASGAPPPKLRPCLAKGEVSTTITLFFEARSTGWLEHELGRFFPRLRGTSPSGAKTHTELPYAHCQKP